MCVLLPPLSEIMHPRAVWLEKKRSSDSISLCDPSTATTGSPLSKTLDLRLVRWSGWPAEAPRCQTVNVEYDVSGKRHRQSSAGLFFSGCSLAHPTSLTRPPLVWTPGPPVFTLRCQHLCTFPPNKSPAEPRWRQASSVQLTGGERWSRTLLTPNQTAAIDSHTLIGPTAGSPQAWNTHTLHLHCQRLSEESSGGNTHTHKGAHTILYTLNGKQWNHKCSECLCALCHSDWRGRRGLVVTPQSKHDGQRGRGGRRVSH